MPVARARKPPIIEPPPEPTPAEERGLELESDDTPLGAKKWRTSEGLLIPRAYKQLRFWRLMEVMSEADWENAMCYVYRLFPRATSKAYGSHSHIIKFQHGFSEDDINNTFGGGRFKMWLKAGDSSTLKRAYLDLPGKPIWTSDEVPEVPAEITDPASGGKGEGAVEVTRLFLEELREREANRGNDSQVEALNSAIQLVAAGARKAQELMGEQGKPASIEQLQLIVNLMREGQAVKDKLFERMLDRMDRREREENPTAAHRREGDDEDDDLDRLIGKLKKLREVAPELTNPESPRGERGWGPAIVQALPDLLRGLKEVAIEFARARVLVTRPAAAAAGLAANPAAAPAPAAPASAPLELAETLPPTPAARSAEDRAFETKQHLVRMYHEGDPPDVVGRMIQILCPELFQGLAARDEAALLQLARMDPQLAVIASDGEFPAFVRGLHEYAEREQRGENDAPDSLELVPEPPASVQ